MLVETEERDARAAEEEEEVEEEEVEVDDDEGEAEEVVTVGAEGLLLRAANALSLSLVVGAAGVLSTTTAEGDGIVASVDLLSSLPVNAESREDILLYLLIL